MPGFGGTQHAWVPCEPRHRVRKEPKRAGFASGVGFAGFAFGAGFAGFVSGAGFAGFGSGARFASSAGFAGFASGAGLASRFAPNPACLGLVEPNTLGFGSLRTQALGSQGTQACWVRVWVPTNPARLDEEGITAGVRCWVLSILNARCWVHLQVLGSISNLAGVGFEQLLSSCK
ncbi:hypothetical protein SLEP1_g27557 [Rubroshorea leprosula]|uniref:Uncharacterized protein n=1 Tax=Rubroshorea leprosula TaxID=152421 RepID=A0AAV5JZH7_9ROSI|nr:hypothetical protein SLEP1_g27557 [Rubroshorea leprosula]